MSDQIVVLITGANRGIGLGLLSAFLARASHVVIACVRDPNKQSSRELESLPRGANSQVIIIKLDSALDDDARTAIETLESKHGITKLDIVIANAGISKYFGKALVTPAKEMSDHFCTNTIAPLLLFQATADLLKAAASPKFVIVSSGAGSLSQVDKLLVENTAYGASKAAVNFVSRRIHHENPYLTTFVLNPGWLQTELGNHAARGAGMSAAPMTVQQGVEGMIVQIDNATRQGSSGRFLSSNGEEIPW